jgi:hypothetical protein
MNPMSFKHCSDPHYVLSEEWCMPACSQPLIVFLQDPVER